MSSLRPAVAAGLRASLVVALATVDRLATDGSEWDFGGHAATIAGDADHGSIAATAVAIAGRLSFVAAILASFRLVGEATLGVKGLLVLGEHELFCALDAIQILVIEVVHGTLIS